MIFSHPASRNIEWRQVLSLLEAIGTVSVKHDGKVEVTVGPEAEVWHAPHGKDVDVQMVVDLRRMLKQAGFAPSGRALSRRTPSSSAQVRKRLPIASSLAAGAQKTSTRTSPTPVGPRTFTTGYSI